jgi:hypothetical protein
MPERPSNLHQVYKTLVHPLPPENSLDPVLLTYESGLVSLDFILTIITS